MTLRTTLLYFLSLFSWFRGIHVYRGILVREKHGPRPARIVNSDNLADWLAIFTYFSLGTLLIILAI